MSQEYKNKVHELAALVRERVELINDIKDMTKDGGIKKAVRTIKYNDIDRTKKNIDRSIKTQRKAIIDLRQVYEEVENKYKKIMDKRQMNIENIYFNPENVDYGVFENDSDEVKTYKNKRKQDKRQMNNENRYFNLNNIDYGVFDGDDEEKEYRLLVKYLIMRVNKLRGNKVQKEEKKENANNEYALYINGNDTTTNVQGVNDFDFKNGTELKTYYAENHELGKNADDNRIYKHRDRLDKYFDKYLKDYKNYKLIVNSSRTFMAKESNLKQRKKEELESFIQTLMEDYIDVYVKVIEYNAIESFHVEKFYGDELKYIPMRGQNFKYWKDEYLTNNEEFCAFNFLTQYFTKNAAELRIKRKDVSAKSLFEQVKCNIIYDDNMSPLTRERRIEDGCCLADFEQLCAAHNTGVCIITHNDICISKYVSPHFSHKTIVGRIFDNHFYPITDKKSMDKIINKNRTRDGDNTGLNYVDKAEEEKYEDIKYEEMNDIEDVIRAISEQENKLIVFTGKNDYIAGEYEDDMERLLIEVIKRNKIFFDKYSTSGGELNSIEFDKTKVIRNDNIDNIIELCKAFDIGFKNQSLGYFVDKLKNKCDLFTNPKYKSSYNKLTRQVIIDLVPVSAYNEQYMIVGDDEINNDEIHSYDINKFYSSVFKTYCGEVPVIDSLTEVEVFDGDARDVQWNNIYFIEGATDLPRRSAVPTSFNILRFDNAGYFGFNIKRALEKGLLTLDQIKYQIRTTLVDCGNLAYDYVSNIFEKYGGGLNDNLEDKKRREKLAKNLVNMTIGTLRQHKTERNIIKYVPSYSDAVIQCETSKEKSRAIMMTGEHGDVQLFKIFQTKTTEYAEDQQLLYAFILQCSWCLLDNMNDELFSEHGRQIVRIDTDCITFKGVDLTETEMKEWCGLEMGKLKKEPKNKVVEKFERKNEVFQFEWKRPISASASPRMGNWNTKIESEDGFTREMVEEHILSGKSCYIGGFGGTGKSHLISTIIPKLKKCVLLSPTNVALTNEKYELYKNKYTLHKFFNAFGKNRGNHKFFDTIIVEEVSMCSPEMYRFLLTSKITGAQIVLLGDFNQLPPVKYEEYELEDSQIVKDLVDNNKFILTKNFRNGDNKEMEDIFKRILNKEKGTGNQFLTSEPITNFDLHLCYTNSKKFKINETLNSYYKDNSDFYASYIDYIKSSTPVANYKKIIQEDGKVHRKKTEDILFEFLNERAYVLGRVEREFKAEWCKSKTTGNFYPFDFVIHDKKTIIELDGKQHFENAGCWANAEETIKRDIYKMKQAKKNGYSIIRIHYESIVKNAEWENKLISMIISNDTFDETDAGDEPFVKIICDESNKSVYEDYDFENFDDDDEGNTSLNIHKKIYLYVGLPLISYRSITVSGVTICKNMKGVVTSISESANTITMKFGNNTMTIDKNEIYRGFTLAYAMTVHKAQGETINKPYMIHEYEKGNNGSFGSKYWHKWQYTAVSRATKKEYININSD